MTPQVLGRQLPPPPPGGASSKQLVAKGLRPTVSCHRHPKESMGAKGARRSMGIKAAQRKILSTLHPNTILKPNLDPNTHPKPEPSPNSTPPIPKPSCGPNPIRDGILGPSSWGKEHCLGDFSDK